MTGVDYGVEKAYEGYLELLPDNKLYQHGSAKILKEYKSVKDEPEVMAKARKIGQALKDKIDNEN